MDHMFIYWQMDRSYLCIVGHVYFTMLHLISIYSVVEQEGQNLPLLLVCYISHLALVLH